MSVFFPSSLTESNFLSPLHVLQAPVIHSSARPALVDLFLLLGVAKGPRLKAPPRPITADSSSERHRCPRRSFSLFLRVMAKRWWRTVIIASPLEIAPRVEELVKLEGEKLEADAALIAVTCTLLVVSLAALLRWHQPEDKRADMARRNCCLF